MDSVGKRIFSQNTILFFFQEGTLKTESVPSQRKDDILIIQNSTVNSGARRFYHSTNSVYKERSEWNNATGEFSTTINSKTTHITVISDTHSDAVESELLFERMKPSASYRISRLEEPAKDLQKLQRECLNYLLKMLFSPGELSHNNPVTAAANDMGQVLGTGGSYKTFYYSSERETTCFDTTGTVITNDGREISFQLSLEMSRSFTEMASEQIDFGQPRFCDPLVINLNTNAASVSNQKFFFDLDADGIQEEISRLGSDSGYLALDKNEDGVINDGSELFGTSSGNGFYDLLQYDDDCNGWIDEADRIFTMLRIWSMDEQGNSTLINLKEAGVGAICLGYEDTEFSLNDAQNNTEAQIKKTGIFLYEEGYAGTVQQIDLAI